MARTNKLRTRVIPGDNSAVICAPHGHDFHTAEIVEAICDLTGLCGLTVEHVDDPTDDDVRVNVNRPTERAGVDPEDELPTMDAALAYSDYLQAVMDACDGNLDLYVEVHGNETQAHVEVATLNIPGETLEAVQDALAEVPCGALVEGIDHVIKSAAANKLFGIIRASRRALHFELPQDARMEIEPRAQSAIAIARAVLAVLRSDERTLLSLIR